MGPRQLKARLDLLRRLDENAVAEAWLDSTAGGTDKLDTVVLVGDCDDGLMKQFLAWPGIKELPRVGDVVVAALPTNLASHVCQGNENEDMKTTILAPPPSESGFVAFWCMVVAIGGITLVPVTLSTDS